MTRSGGKPGFLIIICQPSQGGEGKRHITSGIGDGEVGEVGKQSVVRPCRPRSVGILSLLRQASYRGSRQALHPGQNGLEFTVLFGGGLIERGGLRAELNPFSSLAGELLYN